MSSVNLAIASGAVVVNDVRLVHETDGIALISVDLGSKRAKLAGISADDNGAPEFILFADEETLWTDPAFPDSRSTVIRLDDYRGWHVFAADGPCKYTLRICLTKERK